MSKVSIVIVTLNSEETLPKTLESIKKQVFPQKDIEVLVVDGGSLDQTRAIAKRYKTKVINNPKIQQNYAKFLGYQLARGKYLMFLDSDEALENKNSLKKRVEIFKKYPLVKAVIGSGYKNPPNYPFINQYLSEFGDPFSFFVYRTSKDAGIFVPSMRKKYKVVQETKGYLILDLTGEVDLPLVELTAGGSMVDADFLKRKFPTTERRSELINHLFYLLQSKSSFLAINKKDAIWHYSDISFWRYLNKISWRVKVNIHYPQSVGLGGFVGRNKLLSAGNLGFKKYFFVPYADSLVAPLLDSISLVLTRREIRYLLHLPLCLITFGLIVYHGILKIMGFKPSLLSYGGKKSVKTS